MINLTKMEARHLVMIISDYMSLNPEGFLESNIDVITGKETKTEEILAKLIHYGTEPDATVQT